MPPHGPHGPNGAGSKEKPKEGKKTLIRLVKRLGSSRFLLIAVFIFACVGTLLNTIAPLVLGQATTEVYEAFTRIQQEAGGLNWGALQVILLTLIALYAGNSLCSFICQFIMARVTQNVIFGLRQDMKEKLDRVPLSFY